MSRSYYLLRDIEDLRKAKDLAKENVSDLKDIVKSDLIEDIEDLITEVEHILDVYFNELEDE